MMTKVPVVISLNSAQVDKRANELASCYVDAWQGKEPMPVDAIFDLDIKPYVKAFYADIQSCLGIAAHGFTGLLGNKKVSIINQAVVDDDSEPGRRFCRSTIGHELGHVFLHIPLVDWQKSLHACGIGFQRERRSLKPWEDPEWQAWRFSKALCMPEHLVRPLVGKYGFEEDGIKALVEIFDVNNAFVKERLIDLKYLSRSWRAY